MEIGSDMKICVGNGDYAQEILEGNSYIIILKEKNKNAFCIELSAGSGLGNPQIIQAKGPCNHEMPMKLAAKFMKFLIKQEAKE